MNCLRLMAARRFVSVYNPVITNSQYRLDAQAITALVSALQQTTSGSYVDSNLVAYQLQQLSLSLNSDRALLFLLNQTAFVSVMRDIFDMLQKRGNVILREAFLPLIQRLSISSLPVAQVLLKNNVLQQIVDVYARVEHAEQLAQIVSNFLEDAPQELTPVLIALIYDLQPSRRQMQSLYVLSIHFAREYAQQTLELVRLQLARAESMQNDAAKYLLLAVLAVQDALGHEVLLHIGLDYKLLLAFKLRTRTFSDVLRLFVAVYLAIGEQDGFGDFLAACSAQEREELEARLLALELERI